MHSYRLLEHPQPKGALLRWKKVLVQKHKKLENYFSNLAILVLLLKKVCDPDEKRQSL